MLYAPIYYVLKVKKSATEATENTEEKRQCLDDREISEFAISQTEAQVKSHKCCLLIPKLWFCLRDLCDLCGLIVFSLS